MKMENDFFPVIAGELGTSSDSVKHYQRQVEDFLPTIKVFHRGISARVGPIGRVVLGSLVGAIKACSCWNHM